MLTQIMQTKFKTIDQGATAKDAAKRMATQKVGSLLVEKQKKIIGIVTERDLVRKVVAKSGNAAKVKVERIMSKPLLTIESTRSIHDAQDMMADKRIRHLGVTLGGQLVGLVSVRDLLVAFQQYSEPRITQD
jgi:signal-transduction protein with cAMP-binding, CBS, and nucleotidyltransferase domain